MKVYTKTIALSILLFICMIAIVPAVRSQSVPMDDAYKVSYADLQKMFYKAEIENKINVSIDNLTIEESLKYIAKRTGLKLTYRGDLLSQFSGQRIDLLHGNFSVSHALEMILEGTSLDYSISQQGYLLISETKVPESLPAEIQNIVQGRVLDSSSGEALPGVNILIEGTASGTTTDIDGNFSLTVSDLQRNLIVSYIGYITQNIPIAGRDEILIRLDPAVTSLDDIVVIGYGEQRRGDLTGSVSTVQAEHIQNTSSIRADDAILGRVAGVAVTQNSGQPGGDISIRIRGTNSITASSDPLFVIDGVVGAGDLNTISPDDIETITVLKDASATAIYGARGAGGVVLITTKRGAVDSQPVVSFRSSVGFQQVARKLDLLNASEYAELANDTRAEQGLPPLYDNPSAFGVGTNWQDEIFRTALQQNYNLSVSGGSSNTRYMISGNYLDQDGILIASYFNRGGLRFNLDTDISQRLKIGTSASVTRSIGNPVGGSTIKNALLQPPVNAVYNENGTYNQFVVPNVASDNPVAEAREIQRKIQTSRVFGNVYANYAIFDQLEYRVNFGGTLRSRDEKVYYPSFLHTAQSVEGRGTVSSSSLEEWTLEHLLTYRTDIDVHNIIAMVGYTLQERRVETMSAGATNFTSDRLGYNNLQGGASRLTTSTGVDSWGLESYLFRGNYIYDQRYMLTATARIDGSSKFGIGNRYAFFPSAAFAWVVSNEDFFRLSLINDLKIKTSYGLTGNEGIGSYVSRARMYNQNTVIGSASHIGVAVQNVANPDLRWESTAQLDIGLEVTLLNNRLSLAADWYNKVTDDLLLNVEIPSQTGFKSALQNIGSVQNRGFELSLNSRNIVQTDFVWNTDFNITFNSNKILDLGGEEEIILNETVSHYSNMNDGTVRLVKGEPLGSIFGYVFDGLHQTQSEVDASHMAGVRIGDERFKDINDDGAFTTADKTLIGNGQPKFFGGFGNTLFFKSFELNAFLIYAYGFDILNSTAGAHSTGWAVANEMGFLRDRWTPENRDTDVPRAHFGGHVSRVSDKFIEDGSYIRLQNLNLAYNLPVGVTRGWATKAQVYLNGANLFTLTKYSGYDPMINYHSGSNVAFAIDYNPFPNARVYTFGINIDF